MNKFASNGKMILLVSALLIFASTGSQCPGQVGAIQSAPLPATGRFAVFGINSYPCIGTNLSGQVGIEDAIDLALAGGGWTDVLSQSNQSVSADSFTQAVNSNADAIFFAGHGEPGDVKFSGTECGGLPNNDVYWGVGNLSNDTASSPNFDGAPWFGKRIKWLFLSSSDTVAPFASADPNDDPAYQVKNGSWEELFGDAQSSSPSVPSYRVGQTLRGVYGYWQAPGSCNTANQSNPTRMCDMITGKDATAMQDFLAELWPTAANGGPSQEQDINSAWVDANNSALMAHRWAIVQDCNATNDKFAGTNQSIGNPPVAGYLCYTSPVIGSILYDGSQRTPLALSAIPHAKFTLEPYSLVPRPVDVPGLIQKAQQYLPVGAVAVSDNGRIRHYSTQAGVTVDDYYGYSGGVVYNGTMLRNPVAFTQQTALNAATQYIEQSSGMPGDAALSSISPVYSSSDALGSRALIGYEFAWTHSSGNVSGGDQIQVDVDDVHTVATTCLQYKIISRPYGEKPIVYCVSWQRTVTDVPGISYSYYLWREPSGTRQLMSAGRVTGGSSIDAYTAALSLPNSSAIASYASGYWTSGLESSDNVEHPAWIFTMLNGEVIAVDAFSGQILGEND
ncbi:MAG: hypothetical protein HKL92_10435 [Candidatus Eremiobacteraeota bacterium]|nr:hypothetical protein [Candidatus Eremiobacteraeota bacterium]